MTGLIGRRGGEKAMKVSIEDVAARLLAANQEGFGAGRDAVHQLLADEVHVARVPPWPADGPMSKQHFGEIGRGHDDAYRRIMPDFRQEDVAVSVSGDQVTVLRTLCGTMPDGRAMRMPLHNTYTVGDDGIRRIEVQVSDATRDMLRETLAAGDDPNLPPAGSG
jgi:hypothetical protein